jgi:hypothetical protein
MKNSNDTIGSRTRYLQAYSAVPQPTILLHILHNFFVFLLFELIHQNSDLNVVTFYCRTRYNVWLINRKKVQTVHLLYFGFCCSRMLSWQSSVHHKSPQVRYKFSSYLTENIVSLFIKPDFDTVRK